MMINPERCEIHGVPLQDNGDCFTCVFVKQCDEMGLPHVWQSPYRGETERHFYDAPGQSFRWKLIKHFLLGATFGVGYVLLGWLLAELIK